MKGRVTFLCEAPMSTVRCFVLSGNSGRELRSPSRIVACCLRFYRGGEGELDPRSVQGKGWGWDQICWNLGSRMGFFSSHIAKA